MSLFSDCLNNIRIAHDLQIIDIANLMSYDVSTIYRWCFGERTPSSHKIIYELSDALNLSVAEKNKLEGSYLETIFGTTKFQYYLSIKSLLHFLINECEYLTSKNQSTPIPPVTMVNPENEEFYFNKLYSHHSIINELGVLFQRTSSNAEIYIKLSTPIVELLNILFYNISLHGEHRLNIIFSMSDYELFNHSNNYDILKSIFELFLYNQNCNIYLSNSSMADMEDYKNYIFTNQHAIHFDNELNRAISTNSQEWINDIKMNYHHLKKHSQEISSVNRSSMEVHNSNTENHKTYVYEYMPCVSIMMDYQILDDAIFKELPNREMFMQILLQNYNMDNISAVCELIASPSGLRAFLESGVYNAFPYPVYTPFPLETRKLLVRRLIETLKSEKYNLTLRLHKDSALCAMPAIGFQINELGEGKSSNIDLTMILKDYRTYNIAFYSQGLIEFFKDYFEIVRDTEFSYSPKESIAIMEQILDEY